MRWMVTGVEENPGKRRCQARKFWLGKMIIFLPEKVPKGGGVLWGGSKEESITKQLLYIGGKLTWKSWGNNYSHPFMSKNRVEASGEGELSISFSGGVFFLSFFSVYGTFSIIELIGWMWFDQKKKLNKTLAFFKHIFTRIEFCLRHSIEISNTTSRHSSESILRKISQLLHRPTC